MKKLAILPALTIALLAACGTQGPGPEVHAGPIENALTGEFGQVSSTAEHTVLADLSRYSGPEWSSLNLMLTAPEAQDGAVMGGVFLSNLDLEDLEPGTRIRAQGWAAVEPFDERMADIAIAPEPRVEAEGPDGAPIDIGDDVSIDGIGCSGDDPGNWEKDEPAEEIIIDIIVDEEGEPGVIVTLDFMDDADNLSATIALDGIEEFQDDYLGVESADFVN